MGHGTIFRMLTKYRRSTDLPNYSTIHLMISFAFGGTPGLTRGQEPAFVQRRSHLPVMDAHPEADSLQVPRLPFPGAHHSSLRPNSSLVERVFSVEKYQYNVSAVSHWMLERRAQSMVHVHATSCSSPQVWWRTPEMRLTFLKNIITLLMQ